MPAEIWSLTLPATGNMGLLNKQTQTCSKSALFTYLNVYSMNNSYFSFHTTLVSDLIETPLPPSKTANKSNQTASQKYYSRTVQNCPAETHFQTASSWVRTLDFLYFVHDDVYFCPCMNISGGGITTTTAYIKIFFSGKQ